KRRRLRVHGRLENADERQIAVQLAIVEPITDHEVVGDLKADVLERYVDQPPGGPVEQGHHVDRGRLASAQRAQEEVEGQTGVHDVLDQDHVAARDRVVQVA